MCSNTFATRGEMTIFAKDCLKLNQTDANNQCMEHEIESSAVHHS